jgi:hypothetical protein
MDLHETRIAGTSQACAPCSAGEHAFDPSAAGILRLKRLRRFALPGCVEGLYPWWGGSSLRPQPKGACLPVTQAPPHAGMARSRNASGRIVRVNRPLVI